MDEKITVIDKDNTEKTYDVIAMFNHNSIDYLAYKTIENDDVTISKYKKEDEIFKIYPVSKEEFENMKDFLDTEIFGGLYD